MFNILNETIVFGQINSADYTISYTN